MTANTLPLTRDEERARVVGHVDLGTKTVQNNQTGQTPEQDFLLEQAARPWSVDQVQRDCDRVLAEIRELQSENRWDDIIALFHPVTEKLPELADSGRENEVRLKVAFALCRAGRHAEAIASLQQVVQHEPENGLAHYTLAYTALDALFTARTRRSPMSRQEKKELIEYLSCLKGKGEFKVNRFYLKESELKPEGPEYKDIESYGLEKQD